MTGTQTMGLGGTTLRVMEWDGSPLGETGLADAEPLGFDAGDANLYRYVGNDPTGKVDPTGLEGELPAFGWGLLQGGANTVNGVQDAGIGILNTPALAWNWTAGWALPNAPYIPSPDWSNGLVTQEDPTLHGASKFLGGTGVTILVGVGVSRLGGAAGEVGEVSGVTRLRHHTTKEGLKGIKNDCAIKPSRGTPTGVDVEVGPPFGPIRPGRPGGAAADTGAVGDTAYVEINPTGTEIPTPTVGPRPTARIPTDSPLPINNLNPQYVVTKPWWKFW